MISIKHAVPAMRKAGGGSIICISSGAGAFPHRWLWAYGAAKAGIDMVCQYAAEELGADGIRVNSLQPGIVDNDLMALRLKQRGAEFSIMLGTNELMNSRLSGSEEALAKLSCDRIRGRKEPHILIGGLGMGFTLRAALAELGEDARITVAELAPAVVAWARGPLAEIFGGKDLGPGFFAYFRKRLLEGALTPADVAHVDALVRDRLIATLGVMRRR
jgi:hypothetical protein